MKSGIKHFFGETFCRNNKILAFSTFVFEMKIKSSDKFKIERS
ncbi:hypothetical protein LEP1GSC194_1868 [Leptospira alstonii serovar Sichuan str. 79601]|uniref:Uncharacterized protein n=1 Tax=Leptospira alstonii serovar Sichuan str. 79601 TaxID=1218565 RepID=M6D3S7_9LEPT|nr:hypothetical protein LEP1GSC194_1868 [Leptospira alstonii serovar Sichuan str. 79601]